MWESHHETEVVTSVFINTASTYTIDGHIPRAMQIQTCAVEKQSLCFTSMQLQAVKPRVFHFVGNLNLWVHLLGPTQNVDVFFPFESVTGQFQLSVNIHLEKNLSLL